MKMHSLIAVLMIASVALAQGGEPVVDTETPLPGAPAVVADRGVSPAEAVLAGVWPGANMEFMPLGSGGGEDLLDDAGVPITRQRFMEAMTKALGYQSRATTAELQAELDKAKLATAGRQMEGLRQLCAKLRSSSAASNTPPVYRHVAPHVVSATKNCGTIWECLSWLQLQVNNILGSIRGLKAKDKLQDDKIASLTSQVAALTGAPPPPSTSTAPPAVAGTVTDEAPQGPAAEASAPPAATQSMPDTSGYATKTDLQKLEERLDRTDQQQGEVDWLQDTRLAAVSGEQQIDRAWLRYICPFLWGIGALALLAALLHVGHWWVGTHRLCQACRGRAGGCGFCNPAP